MGRMGRTLSCQKYKHRFATNEQNCSGLQATPALVPKFPGVLYIKAVSYADFRCDAIVYGNGLSRGSFPGKLFCPFESSFP